MGCSPKEKLYLFNWCYYTPPEVIELFEAEFNVKVVIDEFASNEEAYAKLRSGGGRYDIVFPSADYVSIMIRQDMLAEIDFDKLPNVLTYLNIDLFDIVKSYDPEFNYSVPYYFGAVGVMVNTQRVPEFERSWNIFEREDLRGRMIMLDDMREVMGAALIRHGHSINTIVPEQISWARAYINVSWKPNLIKFDSEAYGKAFSRGDAWVVHGYPENVFEEIIGNPIEPYVVFFTPEEGSSSFLDSMVILKSSRNKDLAHEFINFIYRPEIYAMFIDEFRYPGGQVHTTADTLRTTTPIYDKDDVLRGQIIINVNEHLDLYNEAWYNHIRASN